MNQAEISQAVYAEDDALTVNQLEWRNRARRSFPYFCRTALKIRPKKDLVGADVIQPLIPFVFNDAQKIVWEVMKQCIAEGMPIRLVICKARQFGISTFFCAWIFWNMWRGTQVRTAIAAHLKRTLQELLETMSTFYDSFPDGFKPTLRQKQRGARVGKEEMYFTERRASNIIVPAKDDNSLRGPNFDIVLTTEVASYPKPIAFYAGFVPTMRESAHSTLVLESSPKDGFFEFEYKKAKRGENNYRAVFLAWWLLPDLYAQGLARRGRGLYDSRNGQRVRFSAEERAEQRALTKMLRELRKEWPFIAATEITDEQMYWRQLRINEPGYDEEMFNQEYPRDDISCFELATRSAFKKVLPIIRKSVEEADDNCPEFKAGTIHSVNYDPQKGAVDDSMVTVEFHEEPKIGWIDQSKRPGMYMYQAPRSDYTYTIGADVADEDSALDTDDGGDDESAYSVACIYCCNTREQVAVWRGHIDPADFGDVLVMLGYLYNTAMICCERNNMGVLTENRIMTQLQYPLTFRWPDFSTGGGKLTKKAMWETNRTTKPIMIQDLKKAIENGFFIVRDPGTYDECAGYIVYNGRFKASPGGYADRIIAASLAWQCVEQTAYGYGRLMLAGGNLDDSVAPRASRVLKFNTKKGVLPSPPKELPPELNEVAGRFQSRYDGWDELLPKEFA